MTLSCILKTTCVRALQQHIYSVLPGKKIRIDAHIHTIHGQPNKLQSIKRIDCRIWTKVSLGAVKAASETSPGDVSVTRTSAVTCGKRMTHKSTRTHLASRCRGLPPMSISRPCATSCFPAPPRIEASLGNFEAIVGIVACVLNFQPSVDVTPLASARSWKKCKAACSLGTFS